MKDEVLIVLSSYHDQGPDTQIGTLPNPKPYIVSDVTAEVRKERLLQLCNFVPFLNNNRLYLIPFHVTRVHVYILLMQKKTVSPHVIP